MILPFVRKDIGKVFVDTSTKEGLGMTCFEEHELIEYPPYLQEQLFRWY